MIDEKGRIAGRINVIDLLVLLLVLSVVVAGVAFVTADDDASDVDRQETAETAAIVDLGVQPHYIAAGIRVGDTHDDTPTRVWTVEEVFTTPTDEGSRVILLVRLEGPVVEGVLRYGDAPPRLGREVALTTDRYAVEGVITAVGPELRATGMRTLTLRLDGLHEEAVTASAAGELQIVDGQITSVVVTAQESTEEALLTRMEDGTLGLSPQSDGSVRVRAQVQVRESRGGALYRGRLLAVGTRVPIQVGEDRLTAEVIEVDA
jgi:hypothetical protein